MNLLVETITLIPRTAFIERKKKNPLSLTIQFQMAILIANFSYFLKQILLPCPYSSLAFSPPQRMPQTALPILFVKQVYNIFHLTKKIKCNNELRDI